MAQYTGEVRWFNKVKGYRFLGREGGADVFVHISAIQSDRYKALREGEILAFDVVQGEKRPQADKVRKLTEGAAGQNSALFSIAA